MSEGEFKKCPKCGEKMIKAEVATYGGRFHLKKPGDWFGGKIIAFTCQKCGFIELYKEMKERRE